VDVLARLQTLRNDCRVGMMDRQVYDGIDTIVGQQCLQRWIRGAAVACNEVLGSLWVDIGRADELDLLEWLHGLGIWSRDVAATDYGYA
jgi:hypothetical protein